MYPDQIHMPSPQKTEQLSQNGASQLTKDLWTENMGTQALETTNIEFTLPMDLALLNVRSPQSIHLNAELKLDLEITTHKKAVTIHNIALLYACPLPTNIPLLVLAPMTMEGRYITKL